MTIEFKDYAKDIKLNISAVLKKDPESDLKENQIFGNALACAYATRNQKVVDLILDKASGQISEAEIEATKAAATIMAMNNVYYRFTHLVKDSEYLGMPAKLRMNIIQNHGIDKVDFEGYSLAVSAINGCGLCIDSHVKQLIKEGVSKKTIQHIIRISSVVNAAAQADFIG